MITDDLIRANFRIKYYYENLISETNYNKVGIIKPRNKILKKGSLYQLREKCYCAALYLSYSLFYNVNISFYNHDFAYK